MEIYKNLSLKNIDGEIWKEIEGYNGNYFVSNLGRVKSLKFKKEKMLKQIKNNYGYFYIDLYKNGKKNSKLIHVLMYETFIGEIPEEFVIHHKDFTKNNFLDNFKIMINREHRKLHMNGKNHYNFEKHPSEKTRKLMSEKKKGENNYNFGKNFSGGNGPASKLKEQDVIQIWKYIDEGILTQKEIAKKFGISPSTISDIKNKRSWKINYEKY